MWSLHLPTQQELLSLVESTLGSQESNQKAIRDRSSKVETLNTCCNLHFYLPARWWRVLKFVVDGIDDAEVRLQGLSTDGVRLEEEAQVGDNRLRGSRQVAHAWCPCIILHLRGKGFELDPFLVIRPNRGRSSVSL